MEENQTTAAPKRNMLPMIIVGVVLLALGGFAVYAMQNTNSANNQQAVTEEESTSATESSTSEATSEMTADESSVADASATTFTVNATNFKFDVPEIRVKEGDTVKIVFNNTEGFHDWVLDEFDARTKQLSAGQSETIEFVADKAGTYEYYCSVGSHRQMGMVGKLIVE